MTDKTEIIEVKCSNSKCKKVTTFSIHSDKASCQNCGSVLRLKTTKLASRTVLATAIIGSSIIGLSVDKLPEWTKTSNDIVEIYESMNVCMKYAIYYEKQRNLCACALSDAMNAYTLLDSGKEQFAESLKKCE
ncbi:hypothetical protein [Rodentibacter haemolyticus]|uniref:Uncharacterized protein n=1 Tax=Rodentibacter haemolyticus TaxID=2778911 RepID=A0ABX6UZ69_9PAST|nr:hypothetical protein [Rodentibacter haemolyticus]QPB42764.1 hypothetical protein IHV77_01145 [Rodentibacter haemolyticus]